MASGLHMYPYRMILTILEILRSEKRRQIGVGEIRLNFEALN